ncbi:MAG: insertion element protein InsB, partial [Acidobacteriota bacterium]|nr:insertion element protein InsB [Acidobacteriota bacterium]
MNSLSCPRCGLSHTKKNGHTHYRKQNYRCLTCGRQFVRDSQRVSDDTRALVERLLLERDSLRGICRVTGLSLTWLLQFIAALYERLPDDLCVAPTTPRRRVHLLRLEAEVDEWWSFIHRRADKQWLWLAFDKESRQVLAFFVGDRSRESARKLWGRLPATYRERATCYSDDWEAYKGVIPPERHRVCGTESGLTSGIERFNCTLRQRVSRLVRKALSFSKKLENHIGAIKY